MNMKKIIQYFLIICVIGSIYNTIIMNSSKNQINELSVELKQLEAEWNEKTSTGNMIAMLVRSFWDGFTLGMFSEEGIFTESKQFERFCIYVESKQAGLMTKFKLEQKNI